MTNTNVTKWTPAAMALNANELRPLPMPVTALLAEAEQTAAFVEHYWEPKGSRPGLMLVSNFLPVSIAEEIRSLANACQAVHTDVTLGEPDTKASTTVAHARGVAELLRDMLTYVLDDGCETHSDTALKSINARDPGAIGITELAQTLSDLAGLARHERAALARLGNFDPALLDEAEQLATTVLALTSTPGPKASPHVELRDRLINLLLPRLSRVRKAARFVYRDYPELQKKAASAYQRERRLSRKQKSDEPNDESTPADA